VETDVEHDNTPAAFVLDKELGEGLMARVLKPQVSASSAVRMME
jgi:hypothetical protein